MCQQLTKIARRVALDSSKTSLSRLFDSHTRSRFQCSNEYQSRIAKPARLPSLNKPASGNPLARHTPTVCQSQERLARFGQTKAHCVVDFRVRACVDLHFCPPNPHLSLSLTSHSMRSVLCALLPSLVDLSLPSRRYLFPFLRHKQALKDGQTYIIYWHVCIAFVASLPSCPPSIIIQSSSSSCQKEKAPLKCSCSSCQYLDNSNARLSVDCSSILLLNLLLILLLNSTKLLLGFGPSTIYPWHNDEVMH